MTLNIIKKYINQYFKEKTPFYIIIKTFGVYFLIKLLITILKNPKQFKKNIIKHSVKLAQPIVNKTQDKEIKKLHDKFLSDVDQNECRYLTIPSKGLEKELISTLTKWSDIERKRWDNGKVTGAVYHGGHHLKDIINQAYSLFSITNPLHPEIFPYIRKMEAETIRMCCNLFNGNKDTCGVMTSGGTESIILAMQAYRDYGYEKGIDIPEIIAPRTAHAAFSKAAHYFKMKIIYIPNKDDDSYTVDIDLVKEAINSNTVCLVGSAVQYPHGTCDNIIALGKLAETYKIGLHVDSCLGSFLQAYLPKLGYNDIPCDFRVNGVTSISVDTHKFGFSSKGSSVLLWKNNNWRQYHYFIEMSWPGGIYATPAISGSRPGGLIACTWTAMISLGDNGYIQCFKEIMNCVEIIKKGINEISDLKLCGNPTNSTFAFITTKTSKISNILYIGEAMRKKGWSLGSLHKPTALHFTVTYASCKHGVQFVSDLKESVQQVIQNPKAYKTGNVQLYGVADSLSDTGVIDVVVKGYCDMLTAIKQ